MMTSTTHRTMAELEAGLHYVRQSPKAAGTVELIVRRPQTDAREVLAVGELSTAEGLVGDNWRVRGSSRTPDGSAHPDMQLNVMNSRLIALVAQEKERWPLAGDQLFLDLDLSAENLPPGTQLAIGSAIIEVTAQPHTGCQKFVARFGVEALKFISSPVGKQLRLRGINAKVVQGGTIRVGDAVTKLRPIDEEIPIRSSDETKHLVGEEDDFEDEVARTRENAKLMALLDELGREMGTIPLAEVKRQLGLA